MPRFIHTTTLPFPRASVFGALSRPGAHTRLSPQGRKGKARQVEVQPGRLIENEQSDPFLTWRHRLDLSDADDGQTLLTHTVDWNGPRGRSTARTEARLRSALRFGEQQLRDDLALWRRLDAPPATVVVAGSSGLVGSQLCAMLTSAGHRVVRLVRREASCEAEFRWDPRTLFLPPGAVEGVDAVVNLAGETIGGRFTAARKADILSSRVDATTAVAEAVARHAPGATLVQASAVGYYGARRPGELLDESSARGAGFLADVVAAWERSAAPAESAGIRTVYLRTGIALSPAGGALAPQLPLYRAGLGGRMAPRGAWLSWIGVDDLVRAYAHAIFTPSLEGPVNAVAPTPVTQAEFASTLGRALHRPSVLPTPAFGPKLLLGPEGYDQLIDTDQRVSAAKLLGSGFEFGQPDLDDALRHALQKPRSVSVSR